MDKRSENALGKEVLNACITIHQDLGPGLLESVYEVVLAHELTARGLFVARPISVPISYRGITFNEGFRADLVIEHSLILELKSCEGITVAHKKQLLTYLRLTAMRLGYVLNFGAATMRSGIARLVNGLEEE